MNDVDGDPRGFGLGDLAAHPANARLYLAVKCEDSAEWRRMKAEQYPDDVRNLSCALALEAAAVEIRALPGDDPQLAHLADVLDDVWQVDDDDLVSALFEEWDRLIGRHGFAFSDSTSSLLGALSEGAWEKLYSYAERRGYSLDHGLDLAGDALLLSDEDVHLPSGQA
jgi:hypothetical protein